MSSALRSQSTLRLVVGDCVEVMAGMGESSVDAVVCDPPYGLEFMGKEWDRFASARSRIREKRDDRTNPSEGKSTVHVPEAYVAGSPFQEWCAAWAREALRVLRPGGHLLAFGGTRTYHRLVCGVEDAGFEIRDTIAWMYGSGFPKSLDVSKAIDKAAGAEREVVGERNQRYGLTADRGWNPSALPRNGTVQDTAPSTDDAKRWDGWGTALKPAHEPIVVARRPLTGTVAGNVLEHGTGALNIDGCRIDGDPVVTFDRHAGDRSREEWRTGTAVKGTRRTEPTGRWPANVVLDQEAAAMLDEQSGTLKSGANATSRGSDKFRDVYGDFAGQEECRPARGAEEGGASRFFYVTKPDAAERHGGLGEGAGLFAPDGTPDRNDHPTVKPVDLMRWLVRLVTPPGGTVLDPFTGSGTTGIATLLEGFSFIGIEREEAYAQIARARLAHWCPGIPAFDRLEAAA